MAPQSKYPVGDEFICSVADALEHTTTLRTLMLEVCRCFAVRTRRSSCASCLSNPSLTRAIEKAIYRRRSNRAGKGPSLQYLLNAFEYFGTMRSCAWAPHLMFACVKSNKFTGVGLSAIASALQDNEGTKLRTLDISVL